MTVPVEAEQSYRRSAVGAIHLAKRIVDAAEIEAERIRGDAKAEAALIAQDASQSGYAQGMNQAASQIFEAAKLERRAVAAVVEHALPLICQSLTEQLGGRLKGQLLEAALRAALEQLELSPPFTVSAPPAEASAIVAIIDEHWQRATTPGVRRTRTNVRVRLDSQLSSGSCRVENSAGSIELNIQAHLSGFVKRLTCDESFRASLVQDIAR